jgi:hypothetical protein
MWTNELSAQEQVCKQPMTFECKKIQHRNIIVVNCFKHLI